MAKRLGYVALISLVAACAAAQTSEDEDGEDTSSLGEHLAAKPIDPIVVGPIVVDPPVMPIGPLPPIMKDGGGVIPVPPYGDGGGGSSDGGGGSGDGGKTDGGSHDAGTDAGHDAGNDAGHDGGSTQLDLRKSFAVTDQALLTGFSLQRVLDQLTHQAATPTTSLGLYQQWWDTQHTAAQKTTNGPHCDDETTGGLPSHDGFPWQCPRNEADLDTTNPFDSAGNAFVFPIGVFNRFDLAPTDGSNCGEYRIVFGNTRSRNLVIFEAVLPNPSPTCGIDACRPVADLWASLSDAGRTVTDVRARLEQLYFTGLPGFEPVVHINHYGVNGGQIRSNQFQSGSLAQQLWLLHEFKLGKVCTAGVCSVVITPTTVKTNPGTQLFSDATTDSRKATFQSEFVGQVANLAVNDINGFGMVIPDNVNSGQSHSQSFDTGLESPTITNNYGAVFSPTGAFAHAIQTKLTQIGSTLTPAQIVARATTQSCGGCHEFSNNQSLGGGLTWPSSGTFVQVSETGSEQGGFGPAFPISPALKNVFLPHRRDVLASFIARAPSSCGTSSAPVNAAPVSVGSTADLAAAGSAAPKQNLGGTRSVH
jgi:hypothetical protein